MKPARKITVTISETKGDRDLCQRPLEDVLDDALEIIHPSSFGPAGYFQRADFVSRAIRAYAECVVREREMIYPNIVTQIRFRQTPAQVSRNVERGLAQERKRQCGLVRKEVA